MPITEEKVSSPKTAKQSPVPVLTEAPSIAICPAPQDEKHTPVTADTKHSVDVAKRAQQALLDQIAATAARDDMPTIFTALSTDDANSRKFLKQILSYDLIDFDYTNKERQTLVSYLITNDSEHLLEILFNDFIKTRDNISEDKHLAEMAFYFASRNIARNTGYDHMDAYLKNLDTYVGTKDERKQTLAKAFITQLIDETITPDELRNLSKHLTEVRNQIPYLSNSLTSLTLPFFSSAATCWNSIMQKREARMERLAEFHDVSKKECECGHKSYF